MNIAPIILLAIIIVVSTNRNKRSTEITPLGEKDEELVGTTSRKLQYSVVSSSSSSLLKCNNGKVLTWKQLGEDLTIDEEVEDVYDYDFGESIAMSVNASIIAIGSPNNNELPGFVRVYERAYGSTKFEQVGYDITNGMAKEEFGKSVDLNDDGSELIVGIPYPRPRWGINYGYANYYKRDNNLNFYDHQGENDLFGNDGSYGFEVAFGGGDIFGLGPNAIHQRTDTNYWITEMNSDDDDDDTSNIWCKYRGPRALSGDGSILALICYEYDGEDIHNEENRTAYVSIYERNNNLWSKISPDGKAIYHKISSFSPPPTLALSGDGSILAWGQVRWINHTTTTGYISGPVSVYERDSSNNYNQVGSDIVGKTKSDLFGFKVDLSNDGSILAVTAPENDGDVGCEKKYAYQISCLGGHVRIYERDSSDNWVQLGSDINGKEKGENSGESIALSYDGSIVAIGSPSPYNLVRVYELQCDHPPSPFMIWVRKNDILFWSLVGFLLVFMLISLVTFFRFKKSRKKETDSLENDSRPQETFVGDVIGVEETVL